MSEKPLTIVGNLVVYSIGFRTTDDARLIRVDMVIPNPDDSLKSVVASAGDAYAFFNQLGNNSAPFIMTIGGDGEYPHENI